MARTSLSVIAGITLAGALSFSDIASAVVPPLKQPSWVELAPQQREILAPLAVEWDKLESYRRKKWLGIAQRYPAMSVEKKQRLQLRMKTWINLSPEERTRAREKYKTLKKAPPEQRQAVNQKWEEYKNLPDAEKERLKQIAIRKPQPKSSTGKVVKITPVSNPSAPPAPAVISVTPTVPAPASTTPQ